MLTRKLRTLFISDVHVGLPRINVLNTISALRKAFPDNASMDDVDLIVISGDFFDRLLNLSYSNLGDIEIFVVYLLKLCAKRNIVLRVLEGTPSHDWKQSKIFPDLNEAYGVGADCKWVEDVSIEFIESLGISMLYIPDEADHNPDDTWVRVQKLLQDNAIEKVDFATMHGMFEFQLPNNVPMPSHSSERYLSIVNHYISIGHHHSQRQYKRILAQGSFDRCGHGEEAPKGHYDVTVNPDGADQIIFVENELATRFISIDCLDKELDEALQIIEKRIADLPEESHVRFVCRSGTELSLAEPQLKNRWPEYKWSRKVEKEVSAGVEGVEIAKAFPRLRIDRETITNIMKERLEVSGLPHAEAELMLEILEEVR